MKAKVRLIWMKLHAYFSCFFLPLTLVYIVSGVLYLFDIKGEVVKENSYEINSAVKVDSLQQAEQLALQYLDANNHGALPSDHFDERSGHSWYGYKQEVILTLDDNKIAQQLVVKEHDFWLSLLIIHKGYAGLLFWLLGIALGLSLTFSLISGVVISLQMPQVKNMSLLMLGAGSATLVIGFIIG
ncbi:hypothetical protein MHM98_15045 [Psychrobium sp. MM17-31]|uniref:hypothetical protein n=1 Tax=Psychrobium sp. MM17-31 TaxID=2917758 RepID=UPI001EF57512|nr:hypothetical protein [Psychrobium sp. MM17-31]MCG7532649.1 hypothetical protein [Psychrobium sp. MM17-31]